MSKRIDITGKVYGHLTAVGLTEKVKGVRARQWTVDCAACNGSAAFPGSTLRAGMVTSCGCKPRLNLRGFNLVKRMRSSGQRLCKSLPASVSANLFRPASLQILRSDSSSNPRGRSSISWLRNPPSQLTNSRRSVTGYSPTRVKPGCRNDR